MSLPNYVINFEELVESIFDSYTSMKLLKSGEQKSKGFAIHSLEGDQEITWQAKSEVFITGVLFGVDDVRNIGYEDNWDMYLEDEPIMESIYLKEMYEYKQFRTPLKVEQGQTVRIIYKNKTNDKTVWYDIDYFERKDME